MTGPEHFRAAEKLVQEAPTGLDWKGTKALRPTPAVTQAHAAFASVALGTLGPDREREAWCEAAGT